MRRSKIGAIASSRLTADAESAASGRGLGGLVGAEAGANEIETVDSVSVEHAEQVLFDDLRDVARLLDAEPVEDVEAIGDCVAARAHEFEPFCVAEPRRELRRYVFCTGEFDEAGRDQRAHAHSRGQRAGKPSEIALS